MATLLSSETVAKSVGGSSNAYKFKLEVIENSTSIANNTSNVTVNFYGACYSSSWGFAQFSTPKASITVDGASKTSDTVTYLDGTAYRLLSTWTGDITHGSNGEKSLSVSGAFAPNTSSYSYLPASTTISGTVTLTTIPRYTSISKFTVSKISGYTGLTAVKVDWTTADTIDYLYYSKDGGSTWTGLDVTDGTSGSFNITGLTQNTTYSFKIRVRRKDSQLTTDSSAVQQTTYRRNYFTSSLSAITNGNTLAVAGTNPSGASSQIRLQTSSDNSSWTTRYTASGLSKTFSVTEINSLMQYFTTVQKFYVRLVLDTLNGTTIVDSETQSTTYTIANSAPTFTSFAYEDSNSAIANVTGSNQYIVKNKSSLKVIISSTNKMVAKNYATASRYEISCGNRSGSVTYGSDEVSLTLGTISTSGDTDLIVKAYDSRGFYTTVKITISIIDYADVVQKNTFTRVNNFENTTILTVNGTFSLLNCGGESKNTITSVKYRYAKTKEDYSSTYYSLSPTISSNSYKCSDVSLDLDNQESYKIQVIVTDKISSYSKELTVVEGIPILFENATKKNIGVGCVNEKEEYSLQVAGNIYLASGNIVLDYEVVDTW